MKLFISILVVAVVMNSTYGCLLKKKCLVKECCNALTPLLNGFQAPYGASLAGLSPYGYNPYNPYGYAAANPYAAPYAAPGLGGCGCGCGCGCNPIAECLCKALKPCLWKKSLKGCCCC